MTSWEELHQHHLILDSRFNERFIVTRWIRQFLHAVTLVICMSPSQLDPAPSFRCVSVAEATEIADRLYAGHRKKNDGSQEQGRSQTNNKQHQTARTSAAGSSEAADSTSTNKSPVVSVTPAALCCIHPLCFLFYTPLLLHADVVVYTSSTPHYCIHIVTILLFIILSFILNSPHQLNIVHVPLLMDTQHLWWSLVIRLAEHCLLWFSRILYVKTWPRQHTVQTWSPRVALLIIVLLITRNDLETFKL